MEVARRLKGDKDYKGAKSDKDRSRATGVPVGVIRASSTMKPTSSNRVHLYHVWSEKDLFFDRVWKDFDQFDCKQPLGGEDRCPF